MRVTVMNHILDKDATKYPDAYQGDWTFRHPTYGTGLKMKNLQDSHGLYFFTRTFLINFEPVFLERIREMLVC